MQKNFLFDICMEWFFAEILFFKHLVASGTQKAGRVEKIAWGLDFHPRAALGGWVTLASHPHSLSVSSFFFFFFFAF